jgi:protein SCO1/2
MVVGNSPGPQPGQDEAMPNSTPIPVMMIAAALVMLSFGRADAGESGALRESLITTPYSIPVVQLIRDDGRTVSLPEEMNDGRPVILNFVFTTCSSICPLMSQVLAQFQRKLGAERDRVHLMSISIDPEEDTPARLREYARKFHAGPEWQHYTGTVAASLAAQRAFMSHAPVTLVRAAPGKPWLRIEGFVTPDELLQKYHQLLEQPEQAVAAR